MAKDKAKKARYVAGRKNVIEGKALVKHIKSREKQKAIKDKARKALIGLQARDKAVKKHSGTQRMIDDLSRRTKAFKDRGQKVKKSSWWSRFRGRYLSKRTARTQDVKRQVPGMKTDAERRAARKKK